MTLSYFPRLLCLVFACFFLVYLAASVLVTLFTPRAIRTARKLGASSAARFLLTLRLLPIAVSTFAALGFCLPSYLWFEPELADEQVGFACLVMAVLGAVIFAAAAVRAARALVRSLIFTRRCRRTGHEMDLCRNHNHALVVDSSQPFLALTGIVRPRVVISQGIMSALSEEELSVVLSHERAHKASHDNLKRLCLSLAPGFKELERAWLRYAEYAADDEAVAGDARQSVALAAALLRVARFGRIPQMAQVAIPFLGDPCDLSDRIDRLLTSSPSIPRHVPRRNFRQVLVAAALGTVIVCNAGTFRFVQSVLEHLIR